MNQSIPFERLLARIFFAVLVIGLVSAPQLSSENPGPGFAQARALFVSSSFRVWILVLAVVAAIFWWIRNRPKTSRSQSVSQSRAESLPIGDAVRPENGGNALVSASYSPLLKLYGIVGWLEVRDSAKECIVVDGKHVIQQTQLFFAPMVLLGKPIHARRILISPPPLENISATALTRDQLNLTLVVSVKYSVSNPVYVASLSAPISELTNLITGVIVEQVHANTLEDIVKDDGTLRQMLKQRIGGSNSIKDYFRIDDVLKALPTGDERMLEIIRKTREALQKQALIEQEGQNKVRQADFELAIKKAEAQLKEEFDQKQHNREMELLHMQKEYESLHELMRAITQIAASGINPGPALREIRSVLSQTKRELPPSLPKAISEAKSLLHLEQESLSALQKKLGFLSFEIRPFAGNPNQPGSILVQFQDYNLTIDCPSEYPTVPPQICIETEQGENMNVHVPWYLGSNLADAITAATMQVRAQKKRKKV